LGQTDLPVRICQLPMSLITSVRLSTWLSILVWI
jgi:hypothetical protein